MSKATVPRGSICRFCTKPRETMSRCRSGSWTTRKASRTSWSRVLTAMVGLFEFLVDQSDLPVILAYAAARYLGRGSLRAGVLVWLRVGGACARGVLVWLRVGGACGPPPPVVAPLAGSLRT